MNYCNYHKKYDNRTGDKQTGDIENYFNLMDPILKILDNMNISFQGAGISIKSPDFMVLSERMKQNVNTGNTKLDVDKCLSGFRT